MPERSSVLIQDRVTADESLIPGNATRQIIDGDDDVGYWRKVGHRDLLQSRDGLDASGGRRAHTSLPATRRKDGRQACRQRNRTNTVSLGTRSAQVAKGYHPRVCPDMRWAGA